MLDEPRIVQTEARPIAVIHLTVPRAQIREVMGPAHRELMAAVAAQGIAPAGPWFTHHLRIDPAIFDFEIGVPVASPVAAAGRMEASELPSAIVARAVYQGPYEGLASAWAELEAWIAAAGHTPAADLWETYVAGPESSPDPVRWRTALERPLARR